MLRIEVPLDLVAIEAAQDRMAAWLAGQGVSESVAYRVRLVVEELLANLVSHARFPAGRLPACLELRVAGEGAELRIEDAADPFDPRTAPDPALPPSLEDDRLGGLGLALVRRMAEILDYRRTEEERNVTLLRIPSGNQA